jgi:hypothetical protein
VDTLSKYRSFYAQDKGEQYDADVQGLRSWLDDTLAHAFLALLFKSKRIVVFERKHKPRPVIFRASF